MSFMFLFIWAFCAVLHVIPYIFMPFHVIIIFVHVFWEILILFAQKDMNGNE